MAEKSLFWFTDGFTGDIGDGAAPYTQEEFRLFNHSHLAHNQVNVGIFPNTLNGCAVSGVATPLVLATGRATVYGFPYWNDAALNLTVTTPAIGDTGMRVILRAVWSTQTVRAVVLSSSDGVASLPALTQTASTQWEIPIASFVVDTSGDIWTDSGKLTPGVTDTREFVGPFVDDTGIEINSDGEIQIKDSGVTNNKINNEAVTTGKIAPLGVENSNIAMDAVDDLKVGNRVPQFYRRQGGSTTIWSTPGTTDYTPTTVRMQAGVLATPFAAASNVNGSVTFPTAFSYAPIVLATVNDSGEGLLVSLSSFSTTGFNYNIWTDGGGSTTQAGAEMHWLAIGPQ